MSTSRFDHAGADDDAPLVEPGARFADILDALVVRMTPEQRGAFYAQMAAMDRGMTLSAGTVALGRA